jgi:hypothetical protein
LAQPEEYKRTLSWERNEKKPVPIPGILSIILDGLSLCDAQVVKLGPQIDRTLSRIIRCKKRGQCLPWIQEIGAFALIRQFLGLLQFYMSIQKVHPWIWGKRRIRLWRVPWSPEKERNAEYDNHWNDDKQELLCLPVYMHVFLSWFHISPLLV